MHAADSTKSQGPFAQATRAAGLAALEAFMPRAGRAYASLRNTDRGTGEASTTSCLSPFVQRRLVGEYEVIDRVQARYEGTAAEKFLHEVVWRTYWKGWLEQRPEVWGAYAEAVENTPRTPSYAAAAEGRSGIACLDAWTAELCASGYLHNHVRMWFASIWVHTLRLPWALGADLFLRHLLDGDAASNTLSWRWVAGLQTRGKVYLASADNIARCTEGRVQVVESLAREPAPLTDAPPSDTGDGTPMELAVGVLPPLPAAARLGLLLHPEDLALERGEAEKHAVCAIASLGPEWLGALHPGRGSAAFAFGEAACGDAESRAAAHFAAPVLRLRPGTQAGGAAAALSLWANAERLDGIVCAAPFVGPWHEVLRDFLINPVCLAFRRAHDLALFGHANRGYFHLKKRLPGYLAARRRAARQ